MNKKFVFWMKNTKKMFNKIALQNKTNNIFKIAGNIGGKGDIFYVFLCKIFLFLLWHMPSFLNFGHVTKKKNLVILLMGEKNPIILGGHNNFLST